MAEPQYPPPASERWSVNLPAVIGVVFVFLVGVVIWVIVASGDDDGGAGASTSTSTSTDSTVIATTDADTTTTAPGTTTPAPMPDPTDAASTTSTTPTTSTPSTSATPTTSAPPTTEPPPPTTAEGAEPDAVPGDLGIAGYAMQAPPCNGAFITIIASAVGADVAPQGIRAYLEDYPTSNYLRTDQTCPSLAQSLDGEPIYVVYFGPFPFASDACAARAEGTEGSYVRILSETDPPNRPVDCPT